MQAHPKPSVRIYPGSRYTDEGVRYCTILLDVRGLAPNKEYGYVLSSKDWGPERGRLVTDATGGLTGTDTGWGYRDPDHDASVSVSLAGLKAQKVSLGLLVS